MTIAEERQAAVVTWARNICTDPTFLYHLARGDDAVVMMRRLIRKVVKWSLASDDIASTHWPDVVLWMNTSPATLRAWLSDNAIRGSWTIPASANKLPLLDSTTGRSRAEGPNITGTMNNQTLDQHILGW